MKFDVSSGILILAIAAVALDRNGILPFLLFASIFHELAHFLTLSFFGARVESVEFGMGGARANIKNHSDLSYGAEFCAVAAGPAANILLAFVFSALAFEFSADWLYVASGANLVLGIYNLFPMKFLDGGRLLMIALLAKILPDTAERICKIVSWVTLALLFSLTLYLALTAGLFAPLISVLIYAIAEFLEEIGRFFPSLEKRAK